MQENTRQGTNEAMAKGQSLGRLFRVTGFHDFQLAPHPSWWQGGQRMIERGNSPTDSRGVPLPYT